MSYELAQKYVDFQIPSDVKQAYKAGVRMAGSLDFIKMMMFANETQLTNDNIDYYMGIPPRRQEDETYDEMKNRGKLAQALLKYRAQLYDYSVYEKQ
jgi:hypothetical protein